MPPVGAVATLALALLVLPLAAFAPAAEAQTGYAGLPTPTEPGRTEVRLPTPYVGVENPGVPVGVGLENPGVTVGYVGLGDPYVSSAELRTPRLPAPPATAASSSALHTASGAAPTDVAESPPSEAVPSVITRGDIVSLTTVGLAALAGFAALLGRRRLR